MISRILQPLPVLLSRAWTPDNADQIVSNVLGYVRRWVPTPTLDGTTVIFPECGSGYHEWNVILTLIQAGYTINEAIFMDTHIEPLWEEEWHRLSLVNKVKIQIFDSYPDLERWTQQHTFQLKVLVIYINGGLKFGISYCAKLGPSVSQKSAIQFWEWCAKNATNPIVNFMGRDILHPANCKSWSELARVFTEP